MFKVWNEHDHRWEAVSEEEAARRRARGQRVIERRASAPPVLVELELEVGEDLVGDEPADVGSKLAVDPAAASASVAAVEAVDASLATAASLDAIAALDEADAVPEGMTQLPSGLVLPDAALPAPAPAPVTLEFKASSNIRGASLDVPTGILTVSFANGSVYRYANVTAAMMAAWRDARSAGQWFHANIRSHADRHPLVADAGGE